MASPIARILAGPVLVLVALVVLVASLLGVLDARSGASPAVGHVGPSYAGTTAPTGPTPQSKLWYADDTWWGVLWDTSSRGFHIFRNDGQTNAWDDTGILVDGRPHTHVDVLWDGTHLYVASAGTDSADAAHEPRLMKYRRVPTAQGWALEPGFPVSLGGGGTEAVVIAEDSTGVVWATYTQGSRVWVTHGAVPGNTRFVPRYQLPAAGGAASVDPDDVSAVVAYDGDKIGVLWSNQRDGVVYWATHVDGAADTTWTTTDAYRREEGADYRLRVHSLVGDASGRVFAAVKTSLGRPSDPLLNLLVLRADGGWSRRTVGTVADDLNRATLVLDPARRDLYVFSSAPCCSGGDIYVKKTSLDAPRFRPGVGEVFLSSGAHPRLDNPTSSKQPVSGASGLLVLAGDDGTRRYLSNRLVPERPAYDLDPPKTTLAQAPSAVTPDRVAAFAFTSNGGGRQFRCSLDAAPPLPCRSPVSYVDLGRGHHSFTVSAVDAAGNVDTTAARHHWTVDPGASAPVFADDFASGGLGSGGWALVTGGDGGAQAVAGAVAGSDVGARLQSTTNAGSTASMIVRLPAAEPTVRLDVDLLIASGGRAEQTYSLLKVYDADGPRMLSLVRDSSTGRLTVVGKTASSPSFRGPEVGAPGHLQLRVAQRTNGLDSVVVVLDGVTVFGSTTFDLGQLRVRGLRFGDDSLRRQMDLRIDAVQVRR